MGAMNKHKKQLDIINQSMNDARYIRDGYQPVEGIFQMLKYWLVLYILSVLSFFIIDKMNMNFELYDTLYYYPLYNTYRILICAVIPVVLWNYLSKSDISLKERRFLKVWLIFPVLFCLDNCLSSIASFLNADVMLSFYSTFPLSSVVNIVSLISLYSYFKYRDILHLTIVYVIYCCVSFLYLSVYINLIEPSLLQINTYIILDYFQLYRVIEILTLLVTILFLKRNQSYEKASY